MEIEGRYSKASQIRAAITLVVWAVLLGSFVAYAAKGGPEEGGKVAFSIFLAIIAVMAFAVVHRQIHLTSVVRADEFSLSLRRMGRTIKKIDWPEVLEVKPVGRLGGFEVKCAEDGRKIVVEHLLSNATAIRTAIQAKTGK